MKQITSITSDSKQLMTIPLDNNQGEIEFRLYYLATQYSWYYDFTYKNYTSNGNKVVLNPNALRHLRKILPFGIAFYAEGNIEPYKQDDFLTGRVQMYILNPTDIEELEDIYG